MCCLPTRPRERYGRPQWLWLDKLGWRIGGPPQLGPCASYQLELEFAPCLVGRHSHEAAEEPSQQPALAWRRPFLRQERAPNLSELPEVVVGREPAGGYLSLCDVVQLTWVYFPPVNRLLDEEKPILLKPGLLKPVKVIDPDLLLNKVHKDFVDGQQSNSVTFGLQHLGEV